MTPASTLNLPLALKIRCAGWPIYAVTFEALLASIQTCPRGEVLVGRFSPPKHTAYLVDLSREVLLRCVQEQPMRVQLRRRLADVSTVHLLEQETGR